jgi:hypothetical protein
MRTIGTKGVTPSSSSGATGSELICNPPAGAANIGPAIWADNASSKFFGNVYVCWEKLVGNGAGPFELATSRDAGDTWAQKQVTPAQAVSPKQWGQSGCTIRCVEDGRAGARTDLATSPSISIANGARTGAGATNEIVNTWAEPATESTTST